MARPRRTREQFAAAFWAKTEPDGDCLIWRGSVLNNGYGHTMYQARKLLAHRAAYELAHGPIPPKMEVCHRCDRRLCVAPAHLFLGTHAENLRDMSEKGRASRWQAEKDECVNGHPFSPDNTHVTPAGYRECRTCRRETKARYRMRQAQGESAAPLKIMRETCKRGHALTPDNTYVAPSGARTCRTCKRDYTRARQRRNYATRKAA